MAIEIEDLKHDTMHIDGVNLPDMQVVVITTSFERKHGTEVGVFLYNLDGARKLYDQLRTAISEASGS